jgi:hypothetical protein
MRGLCKKVPTSWEVSHMEFDKLARLHGYLVNMCKGCKGNRQDILGKRTGFFDYMKEEVEEELNRQGMAIRAARRRGPFSPELSAMHQTYVFPVAP